MENNMKSKKGIIIGAVAAVAVVGLIIIGVVIGLCVHNGVFLKPADKVLLATKNTFSESTPLLKAVNISDYLESGKFTLSAEGHDDYGSSVEASYIVNGKKQQLVGEVKMQNTPNFEIIATLEDGMLAAYTPLLDDYEFIYHYDEIGTGAIMSQVSTSQIKTVNEGLTQLENAWDTKNSSADKVTEVLLKDIRALEFEKASSKKFKIDGKRVECKGYSVDIDKNDIKDILDDVSDVILDDNDSVYVENSLDELYREIEYMDDLEITFYIKSNKLAAIIIEDKKYDESVEIRFLGGDTRWQNIEIVDDDGDTIMELVGKKKGDRETYKIMDGSYEAFAVSYDSKDGDLDIATDGKTYSFNLLNDGKTATLEMYDVEGVTGKFTLSKKAEFEKYSADETIDIGNADSGELEDLFGEIMSNPDAYDILYRLF